MKAQVLPRAVGLLFGHELTLNPFYSTQSYRALAHLALEARVAQMRLPEVSNSYELILTREDENEAMTVRFEPLKTVQPEQWQEIAMQMSERIQTALHVRLRCEPVAPDSLPRYELKTKRIVDQRPKEFRRALDR